MNSNAKPGWRNLITACCILLLVAAATWGCSHKSATKGPATSAVFAPNVKEITLEELRKNPKAYAGKEVVVSGAFNSICCKDDFVFKSGMDSVEVFVSDQCPMPSKSKIGSKMKVWGTVKVKGDEVSLTAKEVKYE